MITFNLSDFLLRLTPVLSVSLSITGTIIYFTPDGYVSGLSGVKATDWLLPATILFWIISIVFAVKWIFEKTPIRRSEKKLSLTVDSKINKTWWVESIQPDGTKTTQLHAEINVFNRSSGAIGISTFRLIKPKIQDNDILSREIFISSPNHGRFYSSKNPILSGQLAQASISMIIKKHVGKQEKFISARFALSDHLGTEHYITVKLFPPPIVKSVAN